jgi:hypothetical protein
MGFYLRKSIRVGPIRFNLSKSGVGVSAGIKGFRVGSGPRGNYVHMGSNGFYYRQTLPTGNGPSQRKFSPELDEPVVWKQPSSPVMTEIDSGDVEQMCPSSSAALLAEINAKRQVMSLGPLVTILGLALGGWLFTTGLHPVLLALAMLFIGSAVFLAWWRDAMEKTVVLFYNFDPALEKAFELLHDHALNLASCGGIWHLSASGKVFDQKYHAGASEIVKRKPTSITKAAPSFLKTNIETIAIQVGKQTLYLFPDRLLIDDGDKVGAVGYDEIEAHVQPGRFIENNAVPNDAQVVDHTWTYVNKKGGPDRRFANNQQIPICLYDELHLHSTSGLNEKLQFSRPGAAQGFVEAVLYLAGFMPTARLK